MRNARMTGDWASREIRDAKRGIEKRASHGVEVLARIGYAAKGFVYVAVGVLTARAAFLTVGSDAQGSREALSSMSDAPLGTVLLIAIAIGIVGYVIWRIVQAVKDPDGRGSDAKGMTIRGGMIVSAALYAGLAIWIVTTLLGDGSGGGGSEARTWSARLLAQPFGAWLLGGVGVGVIIFGIVELVRAYRASFEKRMRNDIGKSKRDWIRRIARVGLVSRGVVTWMIGGFLVYAAVTANPSQARGLEGALSTLGRQPYGPWLMGLVAIGLAAYGAFQMLKAWYRRIGPVGV